MTTRLVPFVYHRPPDLEALLELTDTICQRGERFKLCAGGTDLLPTLKHQLLDMQHMISLSRLDCLSEIKCLESQQSTASGGHPVVTGRSFAGLRVGAMVTLSELATAPQVLEYFPALAQAAAQVASPQIRNQATIGGNLLVDNRCSYLNQSALNREVHAPCFKVNGDICHLVKRARRGSMPLCQARFVSDTAPALLVYGALLVLHSGQGTRRVPIRQFYTPDGIDRNQLEEHELLLAIEIPAAENLRAEYQKLTLRNAMDFPALGVAVGLTLVQGCVEQLRVGLTGVHTHPGFIEVNHAGLAADQEHDLKALLQRAIQSAAKFALTYPQDALPRAYRKKMLSVLLRRCVANLGHGGIA